MLRVLTACEHTGALRNAFAALGHDAMSCDLKPDISGGHHFQGSVFELDLKSYDLVVAFPPCTYLAKAQMFRYELEANRPQLRDEAVSFVSRLYHAADTIAIENPVGYLNKNWLSPSQIVHPYYFGDPYRKDVCLWLKNVPPLISTCYNPIRKHVKNHTNGRMSQELKSEIKSSWLYYPLMCQAIAQQWSHL